MGTCHLCPPDDAAVPDTELLDHVRVVHPDAYEAVDLWPDGRPLIVDTTLTPEDFGPSEGNQS
jgi:hypothetical protein